MRYKGGVNFDLVQVATACANEFWLKYCETLHFIIFESLHDRYGYD